MAITIDELKRNVFPGESGGDYNALFGYANRPGGQFSGVNLTNMTVDQALQFADPSGPYGQSVKGQIGRVATPMGAYQVVGTTLRGAKEGLGLTGNEVMTPELQDAIGMWIYRNQGPQAWEAWGGGQGGGNVTRSSKGTTGMGLLDMPAQQPQTFGQRVGENFRSGELTDRLALAFNSLRMNPDQNLAAAVGQRQEMRGQEQAANRTAQWLRSRGHDDLASALEAGSIDAGSTVNEALARERPADPMDALNMQIKQLELQNLQNPQPEAGYRQVTGAQLGLTGADAEKLFNVAPTGQVTAIGGAGPSTTVNVGGEDSTSALNKKLAEAEGTTLATYLQQGPIASSALQDLSLLQEILPMAPQSPIMGRAAEIFPGFSSAGAAASSVIKRVAPTLRVEGSGSSSDIEYNGMLQSLPSLQNYPEANAAIVAMMQAKAQINLERSELVRAYQNSMKTGEDAAALRARLSELDARSIMTPELRSIISQLGGAPQDGAAGGGTSGMTPEQAARILLESANGG